MRRGCRGSVFLLTGLLAASSALAAVGETPEEMAAHLKAASSRGSLEEVVSRAWHLKLSVTLFDYLGNNPQPGTIEVWQSGKNRRTVYDFSGKKFTGLDLADTSYRSVEDIYQPYRASEVLQHVLRAGLSANAIDHSVLELKKQSFGKISLNCVTLTLSSPGYKQPGFPTYCYDTNNENILLSYESVGEVVNFKSTGKFLEHSVPIKLEIVQGTAVVAMASVTALSTYTPVAEEFVPTPDLKLGASSARIVGGVISGSKIAGPTPEYPAFARASHSGGAVVLHAIIGRDGHIHALEPISSPSPILLDAAMAAVRQWIYKPYLLNGEPTDVDTTITVNFNLSR